MWDNKLKHREVNVEYRPNVTTQLWDIFNCEAVKVTIIIIFYFIKFLDIAIIEVIFLANSETNNIMPP